MERVALAELARWAGATLVGNDADVSSVCIDSRLAVPGSLFVAVRGEHLNGHDYVGSAFTSGAVAAMVERDTTNGAGALLRVGDTIRALGDAAAQYRNRFEIPIAAVTGSVGKTSTREMIAAILSAHFETLASAKNYNNEFGLPLTLFQLEGRHRAAVLELGMRALGEIDRLAEIARPSIGVITNIGHSHVEILGSRDAIATAKSELLRRLPREGVGVIPAHSEYFDTLRESVPAGCRIVTYSDNPSIDADFLLVSIDEPSGGTGCAFQFQHSGRTYRLSLRSVGAHHVTNALAAIATALAFDISPEDSLRPLEFWQGAQGRMSIRHTSSGYTVLDDCYNAAPESMASALATLTQLSAPQFRVAVLGEMRELGSYAEAAHRKVGEQVAAAAPRLLVTVGPLAGTIAEVAESRYVDGRHTEIIRFADTRSAASALPTLVQPGDVVLVKGSRALAMEQIVARMIGIADDSDHE